jgi:hypothetical protein
VVDLSSSILPQCVLGGIGGHCELEGERGLGGTCFSLNFATGALGLVGSDWELEGERGAGVACW